MSAEAKVCYEQFIINVGGIEPGSNYVFIFLKRRRGNMKKAHFKDIKLDPLDSEGFLNFEIGSFTHFSDAPINWSVSIIELENGSTPYHNHEHAKQHEVIFALSGLGLLKTDDKEEEIREGDIMYFSPNENHQIESLDANIVIACIHINAISS
jgi:mannose-6-phosphate isomerase-like protein (cupin superfamily)